ncbi:MAG: biotin/lipoyl-binding protein, partial [Planctomycetales bacterium]|nr:biotin/lipoyl-binding protein [Planctomycetales bacterium]
QTAMAVVNEGQRVLAADRVAVAVCRRGSVEVAAVSGRERVARRSDATRAMKKVAERVVASGRGCSFLGRALNESPLDEAIAECAAISGARRVLASPLYALETGGAQAETPSGVLLVEHFTHEAPAADSATAEAFERHAAVALANAIRHEDQLGSLPSRLLTKLYSAADKPRIRRRRNHFLIVCAALLATGFLPTTYRVTATGRLLPAARSSVFAPSDARVTAVLVKGGQQVTRGEVLVRLANDPLATTIHSLANRLQQQRQTLAMLQAEFDQQSPEESAGAARLQGRIAQAETEISGLVTRLAALQDEQSRLELRAAHDGTVATFQPEQLLRDRPVRRGEVLLEVMDFDAPWTLLLDCPATSSAQVAQACESSNESLPPIDFVMAAEPEVTHQAVVKRLANHTSQGPDGRPVVEVLADVSPDSAPPPNAALAGGEVIARIDCGRKPLAYVLFGGVYDYVRRIVW